VLKDGYMKPEIIKPKRLSPGDLLGIAAPAGPFDVQKFEKGVTALKDMGFQVLVPKDLQQPDRYLAASDTHRASLLNELFNTPDVKGIICARGGYGSMRILDLMDYDLLRKHPKVFVGFSDISVLISAINNRSGVVAFHGLLVTTLGTASARTKDSFYRALTTDQPLDIRAENPKVIRSGKARGIVSGGNLATLSHLLGTPYAPSYKQHILVLEDTGEAHYRIDRMLVQMKMAGCFHGLSGVALGSFYDCGRYEGVCNIVKDVFEDMPIPILGGFDMGHGPENITIPMGIEATLDTGQGALVYHEAATEP
jgi:muramoyltetrapeptide carboxypeptidase